MEMIDRRVTHRRFGDGIVLSCENGVIRIQFQDNGTRAFHYPEAFDRFLTTDDEALSQCARQDLCAWKLGQEAEDARVIQHCIERVRDARTKPASKKQAKGTTATGARSKSKKKDP